MATTLTCSDPDHASREGQPGWSDNLGEADQSIDGLLCGACAADPTGDYQQGQQAQGEQQANQSAIDKNLSEDLAAMQAILDTTNATLNQNPAAHLKTIARMNKRLGRVALGDYSEAD